MWLAFKKYQVELVIFALIFLFFLAFTFPVFLDPFKIIFGYSGDNFGNIWYFWWQNYSQRYNLDSSLTPFYNAPHGYQINNDFSEIVWIFVGNFITTLTTPIFAFNFLVFVGFLGSFISMYLLANYLTKSRPAAFITALIYALSPYHYWQATSHLSLSFTLWLPMFILSLFYFDERRNLKSAIFLALTFSLTTLTTFYYGFFIFLIGLLFFLYKFIFSFKHYFQKNTLGLLFFGAALVLIFTFPVIRGILSARSNSSDSGVKVAFNRQLDELVGLSARPWDYLIYPPNHPVFGRFNKAIYDFIQSKGNDFKVRSAYLPERVIFLGLLNTLLAFLAILKFARHRHRRLIIFLLVMSFIISMPPYFFIKKITFYTPSYFLYNFFPFIRVYARMGIFVMLFISLISSLTLKKLFESPLKSSYKLLLGVLITLIVLFEFLPNFRANTDLRTIPEVYRWLAGQPGDFIVAEYPKSFDLQTGLLFQTFHQKRLFNMPGSNLNSKIWDEIEYLTNPQTGSVLRSQGVRYVIYHTTDLTPNPYDDWRFFRAAKNPTELEEVQIELAGFKKIKNFREAIVYEIN